MRSYAIIMILCTFAHCKAQEQGNLGENIMAQTYKNKRILITGGCGFIGSHFAEQLVNTGAQVTIMDNLSTGSLENIKDIREHITLMQEDITDFHACIRTMKNQEYVIHCAALVSVAQSQTEPYICNTINIQGTLNLLEAARQQNVHHFIFASSAAVYGTYQEPCSEETSVHPTSVYGYSKYCAELCCMEYAQVFKLNTLIVRFFNVYGQRQQHNSKYAAVLAQFNHALQHNLPITIYGDGHQTRDFIQVTDVVKRTLLLATLPEEKIRGEIVNIASGKSISLLTALEQLKQQYPNYQQPVMFLPAREGDIYNSQANIAKYQYLITHAK